jgi:hypothetical protein
LLVFRVATPPNTTDLFIVSLDASLLHIFSAAFLSFNLRLLEGAALHLWKRQKGAIQVVKKG